MWSKTPNQKTLDDYMKQIAELVDSLNYATSFGVRRDIQSQIDSLVAEVIEIYGNGY